MDQYRFLPLLGRILIGAPFLMSGLSKLATHDATLSFIAAVGLPAPPLAYIGAVILEIGGGLLLLSGYRVRAVSLALAAFCLVTGALFHNNFADQNSDAIRT